MQRVLVLDKNKKPLMPCYPNRAKELLKKGKACVYRKFPFTILLKYREGGATQEIELKIDPGSKTTGIALVAHFKKGRKLLWAGNLTHRGEQIRTALEKRKAVRRSRRNRKTRYRQARYLNRSKPQGWLAPSLRSRVNNVFVWALRLQKVCPMNSIEVETVRFDLQKLENPEISGVEYQQGELLGYEIREYLLEKYKRKCVYCKESGVSLEIEHIVPKSRGGSNRIWNLTLACKKCNIRKGSQTAEEFGHKEVQELGRESLKPAGVMNGTRYAIGNKLKELGIPLKYWSGGRTKKNRIAQGYPKDHWIDAVCVGETGECVRIEKEHKGLEIVATGRGSRQKCRVDKYGFPRTKAKRVKVVHGFQTGDLVRAVVKKGKKAGEYVGKVAIRESGSFNLKTKDKTVEGIGWKSCCLLQSIDGYTYS
jgi:5-methylcytosine-specific restriction endonuclease McrA